MRQLALLAFVPALAAQAYIRTHDDHTVRRDPSAGAGGLVPLAAVTVCTTDGRAWHSQPVSGGGTLSPLAFVNPGAVDRDGRIAFHASVAGNVRNQGIFVADATGLRPVVLGCGAGGGSGNHGTCGDPAPGGGTFAGFFSGTVFVPATNSRGDLLFVADLAGAPNPRGLFLWRADTQSFVKIAAVGDPAPNGGTFASIGPGSLNTQREIVFLGRNANVLTSDVYLWRNGTLTTYVQTGDPAPGGGTFTMLGTESFGFVDGSNIPSGPVPAINDRGQIAFRALATGSVSRGLVLSRNGVHQWVLRAGDATPAGGIYLDFWAPNLNGVGQIAVLADFTPSSTGWFVGAPGAWRKAIAFLDAIDGGQCRGLAASRNPLTPLDDDGNLVFWTNLSNNGDQDRIAMSSPDGAIAILARRGGVTPLGGTYTSMDAWPAASPTGRVTFGAATPGAGGGSIPNARFVSVLCGPAVSAVSGVALGGNLRLDNWGPTGSSFALFMSTASTEQAVPPLGTLRIGPTPIWSVLGLTPYPANFGLGTATLPVPTQASLSGLTLYFQSLAVTGTSGTLSNRAQAQLR